MNTVRLGLCPIDAVVDATVKIGVSALTIRFTLFPQAVTPWLLDRETSRNAGRHQIGEQVTIFTRCVPGGIPIQPIASGKFRIYGGDVKVRTGSLSVEASDDENVGVFRGRFVSDNTDHVGRYVGILAFDAGFTKPVEECFFFELIPGGHQLGSIISLFGIERPAGATVLAHSESGKITQGHLPYLDEGIS